MKAVYKTTNGRIAFEITGETAKDLFAGIASVQEVFESDAKCGLCGCEDLRFVHRLVDDFHFYEIRCTKCFARVQFGQAKKGGGLFPKRKDEDGNWLEHRGWSKFEKPGAKPQPNRSGVAQPDDGREYQYEPTSEDVPF